MHPFVSAAIGGALIGCSAVLLMFLSGRIVAAMVMGMIAVRWMRARPSVLHTALGHR